MPRLRQSMNLTMTSEPTNATSSLVFTVYGTPASQGSKSASINRRTGRVVMREASKKLGPWRQDVKAAALRVTRGRLMFPSGPLQVEVTFYVKRPAGHYGTGRNAGLVRKSADAFPWHTPDVDKLARAALDGIGESGAWRDDAQVTTLTARKRYADEHPAGAVIRVAPETT